MTTVSIHQPHYWPWLPYMNKVASSDTFIVLDTVQLPQGKSKCLRANILDDKGPVWLTIPYGRKGDKLPISDIHFGNTDWVSRHRDKLKNAYRGAPHYDWAIETFEDCMEAVRIPSLNFFNVDIIAKLTRFINPNTLIIKASGMLVRDKQSIQQYVVDLLTATRTTTYLSGRGSGSVKTIDEAMFAKHGIGIEYQNYHINPYKQLHGHEFVNDVSVLDAMFMLGKEGLCHLIKPV